MRRNPITASPLLLTAALLAGGLSAASAQGQWPSYDIGAPGKPKPTGRTRTFTLEARPASWEIAPGVKVQAITYNGTVPGPVIRVTEGDTVRVTLKNSLQEDTSIHWHGLHVPNAQDGVPPLTMKPVKPGQSFTYQFVASHAGTFMYHSHLNSVKQIDKGLYGAFIIDPQKAPKTRFDREFTMMLGAWNVPVASPDAATMPGMASPSGSMGAMSGQGSMGMMSGQGSAGMMGSQGSMGMMGGQGGMAMGGQAEAADSESDEATPVPDEPSGGAPAAGQAGMAMGGSQGGMTMGGSQGGMATGGAQGGMMSGSTAGMMGGSGAGTGMHHPMMGGNAIPMGNPMAGMEGMNYNYFTINGKAFPTNPGWNLAKGELVRVRIMNISNLAHPMHLHGGDFTVIAKDGEPVRPSVQQTMNTLNVAPGETYDIAFRADEVGTWVFHCHELHHTENAGLEPGGLIQAITVKTNAKAATAKPVATAKQAAPAKPAATKPGVSAKPAAPKKASTTTPGGKK